MHITHEPANVHARGLKAVLFDLDDSLFDHRYSSRASHAAIHQRHVCLQYSTLDQLEQAHRDLLEEVHLQVLAVKLSLHEARVIRMQKLFGLFRAIWLNRYGISCPDPTLAVETAAFEPLEQVLGTLF